ncbi:MAG: FHA domain-containing protein [Prevotellaceae bacterium]|jgi:hypothetical protein|nr:FHA domain-containing protein [Prevotellaceae bacterium]
MRCKNCGWENPGGNAKCEKCNAPLTGSMGASDELYQSDETARESFNPKNTARGCPNPECGYPVKPSDEICPNCGCPLRGADDAPVATGKPVKPGGKFGGTVIAGNTDGRKLVGFLVSYSVDSNGVFFPLYEGRNVIGRGPSADICIPEDSAITEKHCSILYRSIDQKFKFKDEQSTNGTFVNEEIQDEGNLKEHDIIRVGSTRLIFIVIPQDK